jgi:hypothetical protein
MEFFITLMFSSFWHFIGCWILIGLISQLLINLVKVLRGVVTVKKCDCCNKH